MAMATITTLLDSVRRHALLDEKQLEELNSLNLRALDANSLARELVQRGWLSAYQVNQLLDGKGHELVLGSYILLERLGEGGMGQVFKARHRRLGRICALKVIRKERLESPDAIRRFQREVQAAAALSHPNVVLAYDADEINGSHLMVMEYIEGAIDLAKLVQNEGRLPVSQACEYVRQAALGLQHAFERGMVHRDIKPANLLVAAGRKLVKLLDLGLARFDQGSAEDGKSGTMTQDGAILGTPDYLAPEQALDTHTVDIRADLYSLGCTFYYLLTGRAPFAGGSLMQKINKHRLDEPQPLTELRSDVPAAVAAIVRKLMAKRPEDRYQTPAELAQALAMLPPHEQAPSRATSAAVATLACGAEATALTLDSIDTSVVALARTPGRGRKKTQRRWLLYAGTASAILLVGVVLSLSLLFQPPADKKKDIVKKERPLFAASALPKSHSAVTDAWLKQVAAMPAEKQVEAVAAMLKILNPHFDGQVSEIIERGAVTELSFLTDDVMDISPLRALQGLKKGHFVGTPGMHRGKLVDLAALRGLPLTSLSINENPSITDLSPLTDMSLTVLQCWATKVSDLTPLKGMPLTLLWCNGGGIADLTPLKDMPLVELRMHAQKITDLSPLAGMRLIVFHCAGNNIGDLAPLAGMPLKELNCDFKPFRDTGLLASIETLEKLNGCDAREFLQRTQTRLADFAEWCKQVAAMPVNEQGDAVALKLKELNPGFDGQVTSKIAGQVVTELTVNSAKVTDISPVRALAGLRMLDCRGPPGRRGPLVDLTPLKGMNLTRFSCRATSVADLFPLKGMPLASLSCQETQVSNLSPLRGMPLKRLHISSTKVSDLSPLAGMELGVLHCIHSKVTDLAVLKGMPLTEIYCNFNAERDSEFLRSLKTLRTINLKKANDFWQEVDGKKP